VGGISITDTHLRVAGLGRIRRFGWNPDGTDLNANNPDTDGDGLSDRDEVRDLDPYTPGVQNLFNPLDPDSTGDYDPDYPDERDKPNSRPDGADDYDGDDMSNSYEIKIGYIPLIPLIRASAIRWLGAVTLCAAMIGLALLRYIRHALYVKPDPPIVETLMRFAPVANTIL